MFDFTKAKHDYGNTYSISERGFHITFETYSEKEGGIIYRSSATYENKCKWWIFNLKVEFLGVPLNVQSGGGNLIDLQNRTNTKAKEKIKSLYKDFLYD